MKNYIQKGDAIDFTLTAAASAGDPILTGSLVGIAVTDGAIGDTIAVNLCGVYEVAKATGAACVVGDKLYWSSLNSNFTKTATGNTFAGHAVSAQASGDTVVKIRLAQA